MEGVSIVEVLHWVVYNEDRAARAEKTHGSH